LVERHFRDRWTVARYAAALGVSRDRLGDICRRIRGRSPSDLIAARVAGEARLLLANSTNSVEQIAALLGFHGAANFNRFFRRATGEPPGRYRARQARGAPDGPAPRRPYEWP
jgi:AraC family transcriptional activator of pobA